MAGRVNEVVAVSALAAIVIAAIAAPVLRAPSERIFGMELVGRHHDPFTVMRQFDQPIGASIHSQSVTDLAGALIARLSGVVAAYDWLVLLSFPLSAAAAYLLARDLTISPAGAAVAAMAYAFSPFHLAHAAYHVHIAQTQWLPLYFLALWRCLDDASPIAVGALGAAALAVSLSNFYGGLIAAVMTPIAVAAYWFVVQRGRGGSTRRLGITIGGLALLAAAGATYASSAAHAVAVDHTVLAFPRADLFRYSAKWWSYLVPPVAHPLLGAAARRLWDSAGVRDGLLEQQVYLGWGIVALGFVAIARWLARDRRGAALARVPVLVVVAVAALACSLSPERTIGSFTVVRPSALLYDVAPMFRAYARFGVVVQLMAGLLAGIGVDQLLRIGTTRARLACLALVVLASGEYAVSPSSSWRDVLPTAAHRWITHQGTDVRALDCAPLTQESESIEWLSGGRVKLGSPSSDCTEPNLPQRLAATGYAYLLVRRDTADGRWLAARAVPDGVHVAASFEDGKVLAVVASEPAVYTAATAGFSRREHDADWSWQWMGRDAIWTIVNTSREPIVATLDLEMQAFHDARRMDVLLDGRPMQTLVVEPSRATYALGPVDLSAGPHGIMFHPVDDPTVADDVMRNGDRRPLSFALGTWTWHARGDGP